MIKIKCTNYCYKIMFSTKGEEQTTVSANTLFSGSYFYSVIIDGKKIDTKQMELLKIIKVVRHTLCKVPGPQVFETLK